jgi:hypothetical protein
MVTLLAVAVLLGATAAWWFLNEDSALVDETTQGDSLEQKGSSGGPLSSLAGGQTSGANNGVEAPGVAAGTAPGQGDLPPEEDAFLDSIKEMDPAERERATGWFIARRFDPMPVYAEDGSFAAEEQPLSADTNCKGLPNRADALVDSLGLDWQGIRAVRPEGGVLYSYYRYLKLGSEPLLIRGFRMDDGLQLEFLRSKPSALGKEDWQQVAIKDYSGQPLSEAEFYKRAEAIETEWAAKGAILGERNMVKDIPLRSDPNAEKVLVGMGNARVYQIKTPSMTCQALPSENGALACRCE